MSLNEKMIEMFYKAATSSRKVRTSLTPVGLIFFFTFTGLFILASIWLDSLLAFPKLLSTSLSIALAIPILVIGLFFVLWPMLHFAKAKGTAVPFNPPQKVVVTGPYVYIRNPILAGWFILLFGLGVLLNSISLFFIFTPLYILINTLELKFVEEPELTKRFGKEYLEYKNKTPMFIPKLELKLNKMRDSHR